MLPQEMRTPADATVYKPLDLLNVPTGEAQALQFNAIKYTFRRQYTLNDWYRKFCDKRGFTPDGLKTTDDLNKIPLIPDLTFKQHPSGKDLASWIERTFTGDLPRVTISSPDPSFDDILGAYNAADLVIAHSTGTSGHHSVIPRDRRTFNTFCYAARKGGIGYSDALSIDHSLSLFPRPTKTNLWAGRSSQALEGLDNDLSFAIDTQITAALSARSMTGAEQQESAKQAAQEQVRKIFATTVAWLERYHKTTNRIHISAPPALFSVFMDALDRMGKHYELGERGSLMTGGGWKTLGNQVISAEHFRQRVGEVFGIPETRCSDLYGMVEMNAMLSTCREGHYYHIPYTWLKPFVLDHTLTPVGYGEWGRFAFLDALARSYPGFVMTGDQVRLLEHCPVCDRPGPVLDRVIKRMPSEDMRGCAEEVRRVFNQDLAGALAG